VVLERKTKVAPGTDLGQKKNEMILSVIETSHVSFCVLSTNGPKKQILTLQK